MGDDMRMLLTAVLFAASVTPTSSFFDETIGDGFEAAQRQYTCERVCKRGYADACRTCFQSLQADSQRQEWQRLRRRREYEFQELRQQNQRMLQELEKIRRCQQYDWCD